MVTSDFGLKVTTFSGRSKRVVTMVRNTHPSRAWPRDRNQEIFPDQSVSTPPLGVSGHTPLGARCRPFQALGAEKSAFAE
jgi:hypothetical protein